MPFAICFNLDQSKILSSGNGSKGALSQSGKETVHVSFKIAFARKYRRNSGQSR